MSHPAVLIQKIIALLERDYPPAVYKYVTEAAIPGTRMYPDVQVRSQHDQIVCVAEVGYTRPEKLTAYRDALKIPDVRWYDKQGNLHADVKEAAVSLKIHAEPAGQVYEYFLDGEIECPDCLENGDRDPAEETDEEADERWLYAKYDVFTTLVTDYTKAWVACFCDKCGNTWLADRDEAGLLLSELQDPACFGRDYGRRTPVEWREIVARLKDEYELDLNYADGQFICPSDEAKWHDTIMQTRLTVLRQTNTEPEAA